MIPYSRPKLSDLYTLSQTLYCTLHSGTYLYSPYMTVPPQPLGEVCPQGASSRDARSEGSCPRKTWRYLSHLVPSITPMAILFSCAFCSTNCQGSDMEGGGVSALHVNYYFFYASCMYNLFFSFVCIVFSLSWLIMQEAEFFTVVLFPFLPQTPPPPRPTTHTHTHPCFPHRLSNGPQERLFFSMQRKQWLITQG